MQDDSPVMIIGSSEGSTSNVAERIRDLGYPILRVGTPGEAMKVSEQHGRPFRTIVIGPTLASPDLSRDVATLATQTRYGRLDSIIAAGKRPDTAARARLQAAGVVFAMWNPVGDHTLRFLINRASSDDRLLLLRQNERIPTEWSTQLSVEGRCKFACIYSLSGGGAYLATQRPSEQGTELEFELPLRSGEVSVAGRVLYTSESGDLRHNHLPDGMAIQFTTLQPSVRERICESVEEISSTHRV